MQMSSVVRPRAPERPEPHAGDHHMRLSQVFRNFLCVKLTYYCGDKDALQQDLNRDAKVVGPLSQEFPIFRLNVVRS
jgi:hypothetical protein